MTADVRLRPLTGDDIELLKLALYLAVTWNPDGTYPPYSAELLEDPDLAAYHTGWGRRGDLGLVAEQGDEFAGLVFCRLFSDDEHGHGFVDAETPELGIAVVEGRRGQGIGTTLLDAIAAAAASDGVERLSLSVDAANPARNLYERLGYREVRADEGGRVMVLDLGS